VKRDALWCGRHAVDADELGEAARGEPEDAAAREFRRRLATGEYRALFGAALTEAIEQAAAERGLADEIGILRVVLARLLVEERDPAQLAVSVSKVAAVAIQAARAQRAINGEPAGNFSDAVTTILIELDEARATSDERRERTED
jgi:hypothetical protein